MRNIYSLYEAKAKLSAIIRQVREGRAVTVTLHGKPVAEIRPIAKTEEGIAARLMDLESKGVITPATGRFDPRPIASRPGALKRFLDERD